MSALYSEHVELYDIAFGWDIGDEVEWLVERLGPACRSVLEPGCGTGRMLEALAQRGLDVLGVDSSEAMVEFARARLARAGVAAEVVREDMTTFELGRRFDGAVCPINTLSHLDGDELARHLERMAAHLERGARYLVQVGVLNPRQLPSPSNWEAERGNVKLRVTWAGVDRDLAQGKEQHHSRIEILTGPRAGEVLEEAHTMAFWTPTTWRRAIEASPFQQVATYDGNLRERPRVELEQGGGLLWHELVAP